MVIIQHQKFKRLEIAKLGRNGAAEVVFGEIEPLEVVKVAQFGRNRAAKRVAREIKIFELREVA